MTPHSTTGQSPAEMLMGRRLRSALDLLHPDTARVMRQQLRQKAGHDNTKPARSFLLGERVYAHDFRDRSPKWIPGEISKITGPLSYEVKTLFGVLRRHVDHLRKRVAEDKVPAPMPDNVDDWGPEFDWSTETLPQQPPVQTGSFQCQDSSTTQGSGPVLQRST